MLVERGAHKLHLPHPDCLIEETYNNFTMRKDLIRERTDYSVRNLMNVAKYLSLVTSPLTIKTVPSKKPIAI